MKIGFFKKILSLFTFSLSFKKGNEGDPLSPPEGEAPQGEDPLTPNFRLKLIKNSRQSFRGKE
jgi:hypothetical protein